VGVAVVDLVVVGVVVVVVGVVVVVVGVVVVELLGVEMLVGPRERALFPLKTVQATPVGQVSE